MGIEHRGGTVFAACSCGCGHRHYVCDRCGTVSPVTVRRVKWGAAVTWGGLLTSMSSCDVPAQALMAMLNPEA